MPGSIIHSLERFVRLSVFPIGLVAPFVLIAEPCIAQKTVATEIRKDNKSAAEKLLARPTTLNLERTTREAAIRAASANAGVSVQYRVELLEKYRDLVTVRASKSTLGVVLEQILAGTTLHVVADGETQLAIVERNERTAQGIEQQERATISGTVTDSATGQGLKNVTLTVSGTKITAVSGDNGTFTIRGVPSGNNGISARLFGYRSATKALVIPDTGKVTVSIALAPMATTLSGVVTTATGMQQKMSVGNDITRLNVDSILKISPVQTLTDLLENRVPGMTVIRSSGVPGSPSRVRLRGTSSVTGNNDPIVVIDGVRVYAAQSDLRNSNGGQSQAKAGSNGVPLQTFATPSPLDQLDPNTIESIDVLKGPSASSLYGSDAANGVIVITTKRGRSGRTHWNISMEQGIQYSPGKYPNVVTQWGKTQFNGFSEVCLPAFGVPCIIYDSTTRFQALNSPQHTRLGRGSSTFGTATVSGGNEALSYSLTGSASTTTGLIKLPDDQRRLFKLLRGFAAPDWSLRPDALKTWGGSGSVGANPRPNLQLTVTAGVLSNRQLQSSLDLGAGGGYIDTTNAILGDYFRKSDTDILTTRGGLSAQWSPVPWLPIQGTFGLDASTRRGSQFLPRGFHSGFDSVGSYSVSTSTSLVRSLTMQTRVPLIGTRLESAFGFNYYDQSLSDVAAGVGSVPPGNLPPTDLHPNGITQHFATQSSVGTATYGWYLEPKLNLNSRFFVMPGFRLDGGTSGTRSTFSGLSGFPKLSFSWVASEEPKFPLSHIFNVLRFRGAYGQAGVQPTPAQRFRLATTSIRSFDGGISSGEIITNTNIGNTRLRPERSVEFERGVDIGVWDGRANFGVTFVNKTRRDAIIDVRLPLSLGYSTTSYSKNIGVIRNRVLEMSGDVQPIRTQSITWNVNASLSRITNVVVRLNPGEVPIINAVNDAGAGTISIVPGYPLFGVWAYPIRGFADANGDGLISTSEVVIGEAPQFLGPSEPNYQLSASSGLSLLEGRLTLNASMSYKNGMTQVRDVATVPAPNSPFSEQAAYAATLGASRRTRYGYIQQVNTLQLNNASVTYVMPTQWARRLLASSMSVSLFGNNLGLRTNYRGKDPNVNGAPYGNSVVDSGQLPSPRMWSLRISLIN